MANKCKIYILVGEKYLQLEVDSSLLPKDNQDLYKLLSEKLIKQIASNVEELMLNRASIDKPDLNKILESSHIISNATIGSIRKRYPELKFPEDTEDFKISDIKVLFLNEFKTHKGELKYGRFINPNGEEIFIIDRSNAELVANYFATLKKIQTSENVVKLLPFYEHDLKLCLKEVTKTIPNIKTTKDLLVNYLLQKFKFRDIIFNDDDNNVISAHAFLDKVTSDIFEISVRKEYKDHTVNNINNNVNWDKKIQVCSISTDQFFLFLDTQTKNDLIKYFGKNYQELIINNKISKDRVKLYFGQEGNPLLLLVSNVLSRESGFNVNFKELRNGRIYMEKFFPTLEKVYGIGFNELLQYAEPIYYNGKWIQKINKKGYYVTRFYTTESLVATRFDTLREAKLYIDNNKSEEIVKHSLLDLHKPTIDSNAKLIRVKTEDTFLEGTLITILDYDIPDIPLNLIPSVDQLFITRNYINNDPNHKYATMEDFHNYVKNNLGFDSEIDYNDYNYIIKKINTPEKVALFIMELNKEIGIKNDPDAIKKIATTIGNITKKRYYLVEKSTGKYTTLLKINNESTKEYRNNHRTPVVSLWNGAKKAFENRLGIPLVIDPEPEEGKENAKAYIKDNTIHINLQKAKSSDLLHEYAHILLGYLKIYNRDVYLLLINTVWKIGDTDGVKYYISNNYKDSSLEDRMEEYFVEKFGLYVTGKSIDNDFEFIFNSEIIEETKNIFTDQDIDIKKLYGSSIEEVFLHFSSDISAYFDTHKTLMDSDFKELFKVNRQKSEWIRKLLNEGKLIEYDCK